MRASTIHHLIPQFNQFLFGSMLWYHIWTMWIIISTVIEIRRMHKCWFVSLNFIRLISLWFLFVLIQSINPLCLIIFLSYYPSCWSQTNNFKEWFIEYNLLWFHVSCWFQIRIYYISQMPIQKTYIFLCIQPYFNIWRYSSLFNELLSLSFLDFFVCSSLNNVWGNDAYKQLIGANLISIYKFIVYCE